MDIVNNSAVLITSYHMLDAVVRGMFTPSTEVTFTNTNTNTISGVLCILDFFISNLQLFCYVIIYSIFVYCKLMFICMK